MGKPIIQPRHYVVDRGGREKAVQISMDDWQSLMDYIADLEQQVGIEEPPTSTSGFKIRVDDLLQFARSIEGHELQTTAKSGKFTVQVMSNRLIYTPATSGIRRFHDRNTLEQVCRKFNLTNSFTPGDYREITMNASYTLALIKKYLEKTDSQ